MRIIPSQMTRLGGIGFASGLGQRHKVVAPNLGCGHRDSLNETTSS